MPSQKIKVAPLEKEFKVELQNANRKKRNNYYPNVSNCCGNKLKQRKECGECGQEHKHGEANRKMIELGEDEYLIEKDALGKVKEKLKQMDKLNLHTFLEEEPENSQDRYSDLIYAVPEEENKKEYQELRKVLQDKVAIGEGVFRSNEYQVIVTVGDDGVIRIRKLVDESQRYDYNPDEINEELEEVNLNDEVVDLEKDIINDNLQNNYDLTNFKDSRTEYEEQVIEDYILHGELPEEFKTEVEEKEEENELERLKKLKNGGE